MTTITRNESYCSRSSSTAHERSEQEKARRWNEIRIRQHRLMAEVEAQTPTPAHIDHIMKSGFTMSDIKGMSRSYGEDAVEADEQMLRPTPGRPPRKGSLTRGGYDPADDPELQRSTSAMDIGEYQAADESMMQMEDEKGGDEKKRGRSPFRFFKKSRDQSKDKMKSRSPEGKKQREC